MKELLKWPFWIPVLALIFGTFSAEAQSLEDYLQIAAENNPELKAAYAQYLAASKEAPQVSTLPDPTLAVNPMGMGLTKMGPQKASFSLMQMFPWFGTLDARGDRADIMAEAEYQAYLALRNEVLFEVEQQFYELYELQENLEFEDENLVILEEYRQLALSRVRAGSGQLTDVLQADLVKNESGNNLEILVLKKQAMVAEFNALLGRNSDAEVDLPEEILAEGDFSNLPPGFVSGNPRLLQAEKMKASAEIAKVIAEKEGMPSFGIGLEYMIIGEGEEMLMDNAGRDAIMPMFTVSLPIFRKKYEAAKEQAEYLSESYEFMKKAVENELIAELEVAEFAVKEAQAELRLYQKQLEATQQILDLLISSYSNATADFEEVLRVRQELLKYQLAVVAAEADLLSAIAKIEFLSGKTENYEN